MSIEWSGSDRIYFVNPKHWGWKDLGQNYLQQEWNRMDVQQDKILNNFGNDYLYVQPAYFQTGLDSQYDTLKKAGDYANIKMGYGGLLGSSSTFTVPAASPATKKVSYGTTPWAFVYLTEAQLEITAKSILAAKDAFDQDRAAAKQKEAQALKAKLAAEAEAKRKHLEATRTLEPGERVSYITSEGLKKFGIVANRKNYNSGLLIDVVWAYWDGYAYPTWVARNKVTPDNTRG